MLQVKVFEDMSEDEIRELVNHHGLVVSWAAEGLRKAVPIVDAIIDGYGFSTYDQAYEFKHLGEGVAQYSPNGEKDPPLQPLFALKDVDDEYVNFYPYCYVGKVDPANPGQFLHMVRVD